ncbi:unnamed protein product, partial [Mesorhabditis belari]|uniref:Uncharacterized protein n=1 Tax=Mesorhabditis belari TaxID=2138241 RepID=A0AAF3E9F8_9BILA
MKRGPDLRNKRNAAQGGYGVMPKQSWRFSDSMDRIFTMQYGRRYGLDVGLSDRMILLSLGSKNRRLDDKKVKQITEVFQRRLIEIIGCHDKLAGKDLMFSRVTVDKGFSLLSVNWICKGEGDEDIEQLLEQERHSLRRQLSESLGGGSVPEIRFIADKTELKLKEMEQLFKQADYGVDYRTLSNAARVMGNVPDPKLEQLSSSNNERQKPPPAWKVRWDEKKEKRLGELNNLF